MGTRAATWRPIRWGSDVEPAACIIETRDPKLRVHYTARAADVAPVGCFGKVGTPSEASRYEGSYNDFLDLNPSGYAPGRDFVLEARQARGVFVSPSILYVLGESTFYRVGRKYLERETAVLASKDVARITAFVDDLLVKGPEPVQHIAGTTIVLQGWSNFDHFIRQPLSSLLLSLDLCDADARAQVHLLMSNLDERIIAFLEMLGFDRGKILPFGGATYSFERLLYSPDGSRLKRPSDLYRRTAAFLSGCVDLPSSGAERIYVSRALARRRKIVNEAELESRLATFGYVSIDPGQFTYAEQIAFFRQARCIVGPHGQGLANAIFAAPMQCLVEIMPTTWMRPSYLRTAQMYGAAYGAYLVNPRKDGHCEVDVDAFLDFIRPLGALN
ncbi:MULTISPECIES: glycosyltransferase family 61 protein [unclassified Xanthobacter]|uniref:glycosyltransferase family 61 protein n=1 Tax=unclassified Xanthobacter TaxID=2623496 RepID=UPI001EE0005D|nr:MULTISPECIES: glycosyltransferase family 61 protein [unclassified Xanthobacter]